MMGAAIATVAAYSTMAIAMAWWSQRIYPVPYQWRRVVTATLGAVGLAAIGKGLGGGIPAAIPLTLATRSCCSRSASRTPASGAGCGALVGR